MMPGRCETCGKVCHLSRKAARQAARQMRRDGRHLSAYRCGPWWHLGTAPQANLRGEIGRDEIYTFDRSRDEVTRRRKGRAL